MNLTKRLITLTLAMIFSSALVAEGHLYIVQDGDTLSEIAAKYLGKPIFSKNGSLAKLIRQNVHIQNPDKIIRGDKIYLEEATSREPAEAAAVVETKPVTPPPTCTEVKTPSDEFPFSRLRVDAGFEYFRIDAHDSVNGGNATLLSGASPTVHLSWDLAWDKRWDTRLRFNAISERILDATNSTSSITNGSGKRYGFEFGPIRKWNAKRRTGFFLGSSEQIFSRSVSATVVTIDRVQAMFLKATHEEDLLTVKTASAGVGASFAILSGGTGVGYRTNPGWAGDIFAHVRHEMTKSNIEFHGTAYYGMWAQDSTLVTQKGNHIGVMFGVSRRFGE